MKYLIDCLQKYKFKFPVSLTIIGHKYTGLKPDNIEIINPGIVSEKSKINHLGGKAVSQKFSEEVELSRNWHWIWSKFYFYKKRYLKKNSDFTTVEK